MKHSFLRLALPIATLALLAPSAALAQKGKVDTGGSTGPTVIPGGADVATYVISQPGSYLLGGDRLVTNVAQHNIEVTAPDVTLDLGGFTLAHLSSLPAGAGCGVMLSVAENVEIRNGSITDVPRTNIAAPNGGMALRVVNVRLVGSRYSGIEGSVERVRIKDCEILGIPHRGIFITGKDANIADTVVDAGIYGIYLGERAKVSDTTVRNCTFGITLGAKSRLADSIVSGANVGVSLTSEATLRDNDIFGNSQGVYSPGASNVFIGNRLSNTLNVNGPYVNGGGNVLQ